MTAPDRPAGPPTRPSAERRAQLAAVAAAHDAWVDRHLTDPGVVFTPEGRKSPSDYNQHYLDVTPPADADTAFFDAVDKATTGTRASAAVGVRHRSAGAGPIAAGLAVHAADTGRVLMLQRAITDDDPAGGTWEFPGGHLDDGEPAQIAAMREWQEETGHLVPEGETVGTWLSRDGVYQGFVHRIPHEAAVPVADGRDQVINPDDPDGDQVEALAWWDPAHLLDNPAVRPELAATLPAVMAAIR